jgi:hypothetical protein
MPEEMQAKAREINAGFELFGMDEKWVKCGTTSDFHRLSLYRLRADYEEKPGIEEVEIKICGGDLTFKRGQIQKVLCVASNDPGFVGFENDGLLWGCLYRNKTTQIVRYYIPRADLDSYDVITPENGKVQFRSEE